MVAHLRYDYDANLDNHPFFIYHRYYNLELHGSDRTWDPMVISCFGTNFILQFQSFSLLEEKDIVFMVFLLYMGDEK
eukprot:Gb_04269 [translate_table: standard]